jgi:hypothetical protein
MRFGGGAKGISVLERFARIIHERASRETRDQETARRATEDRASDLQVAEQSRKSPTQPSRRARGSQQLGS